MICLAHHVMFCQTFVLNGSATASGGGCYQLTPDVPSQAGSIFSQNSINLTQPFSLNARFFFGCKDANGADGIMFIFSTLNTSLGAGGGGIGYQGITPSIAIEYDDYFNSGFNDPTSDHMAVTSMGSMNHSAPTNLAGPINLSNIEDCMEHCFSVNWNPVTQTLTAILDGNTISYTGNIVANIFSGNPVVYYGFSSGTGSLSNTHRVCFGPPVLEPMPDVSVCEGEGIGLQADPNGINWSWAPHPTLSSYSVSNPTATPDITTTYTVTIEYNCGYIQNDTVVVNVIPAPEASASNNGPVCLGESLSLMAEGGVSYQWSGPAGFSSSGQNPVINAVTSAMGGTYAVTVTDAAGCTDIATTFVVIDPGPAITIDPPPAFLCENAALFQMTASPSGGTWDGDITVNGLFDPGYAGVGIHTVTYTATNANGCSNTAQANIEVVPFPEVLIDPQPILCEDSDPVQLTGSPPGGIWNGEISLSGLFDPGDAGTGPHLITYTANDGNGCTNSAEIIIEVAPSIMADISPDGPFCITDPAVQLLVSPSGGIWGGAANPSGIITPAVLGAGMHEVTYSFMDQNGCYSGLSLIEILLSPVVSIDSIGPLCPGLTMELLSATPPGGTWSGAAMSNGEINPSTLGTGTHQAVYTFALPGGCSATDTFDVVVLPDAPRIINYNITCDSMAASYFVTFSISGGVPLTYDVQGNTTGTLTPGAPYIFTSDPITTGSSYVFIVNDENDCDPDTLTGVHSCNCITNAGMMDLTPLMACKNDTITVLPPSGYMLDQDDSLVYVLHQGFPSNILFISQTNQFVLAPPLMPGTTYYVSSVAGNALPGMGVSLSDPCLSASLGTPVMWADDPDGWMSSTSPLCKGDSVNLQFLLSGGGPFDIVYSDGSNQISLSNIPSGHSIFVHPAATTTYTLQEVTDLSSGCSAQPDTALQIEVISIDVTQKDTSICLGDSVVLSGQLQFIPGVYIDSLTSMTGCDSIVETTLIVHLPDTVSQFATSCDSTQTGVFTTVYTNQHGCDSLLIHTVSYAAADSVLLQSSTCDPVDAGVYTSIFTSQKGCDSIVIETITYIPPDTTYLQSETCDPAEAGTSTILLSNTQGCDSLIIKTITLLPSDSSVSQLLTCSPSDTGIVAFYFTNTHGCDSIVWTITSLAPDDTCHIVVIVNDVFVPNVFSPNRDGQNDYFMILAKPGVVSKISLARIYDRWGGLVWERHDIQPNVPEQGWDGTERGKHLGPGVFLFVAQIEYANGKHQTVTGDITLIR